MNSSPITIVGAGLVGTLLATLLAQRGLTVRLYEKRADPRKAGFAGGRSINLALAERGLNALRQAGLDQQVLDTTIMMRGRMVHATDGRTNLQRYGIDDTEVNQSVDRGTLNKVLLDAAEAAGVALHFEHALLDADFAAEQLQFEQADGSGVSVASPVTIGADGAGSALRKAMNRSNDLGETAEPLGHAYKELEIPPLSQLPDDILDSAQRRQRDTGERFAIEPNALHIWPRNSRMCIALPNNAGSFTVTLFLAREGAHPSFASVPDVAAARAYFAADYPNLLPLMPDFDTLFESNPVGSLATLYLNQWHLGGKALLVGDAAHAVVPFHGQGMNAGFEDAATLAPILAAANGDLATTFADYQRQRKPDTDAIAALSLENYVEMRDSVVEPNYLAKRTLSARLAEHAPERFMPRYRLVTFTNLPYAQCLERGRQQDQLLERLLAEHGEADAVAVDTAVAAAREALAPLPRAESGG